MTSLLRFPRFCAALALVLGPALALGADEPLSGYNNFSTPGYPARSTPRQPGAATPQGSADPAYPSRVQIGNEPGTSARQSMRNRDDAAMDPNPGDFYRRTDRPEPRPSEFQRFVEQATGRMLPAFGAGFFADAADSFSPLNNVPVSADYTVGPGDEIVIRGWGSIDIDFRSTVDRNGMLNLPRVGSFSVTGVKASDLERHLRAQIGPYELFPKQCRGKPCRYENLCRQFRLKQRFDH